MEYEGPLSLKLMREVIQVKSVKSRLLEPGFAYLRITQFQSKTAQNLQQELQILEQKNQNPLKGLVLDLRNNSGGVLSVAVDIADSFLENGIIFETKGRSNSSYKSFTATPGDLLKKAPLVVSRSR